MSGSGVSPGSKRTFSCYRYFKMIGSKEITCLDNGQWSGPAPTCKIKGIISCLCNGLSCVTEELVNALPKVVDFLWILRFPPT